MTTTDFPEALVSHLDRLYGIVIQAQHDNGCERYHRSRAKSRRWQCTCWKQEALDLIEGLRDGTFADVVVEGIDEATTEELRSLRRDYRASLHRLLRGAGGAR